MKKIIFLICILCAFGNSVAQVLTFQSKPGPSGGEDAFLASISPSVNYGSHPEFAGTGWTCLGVQCTGRGLLRFNLSSIPQNAIIQSAELNLYACSNPVNGNGQPMFGLNSAHLYRVTSPWIEDSVNFNNQPTFTVQDAVFLPTSISAFQNYLSVNIYNIVQQLVSNPSANYGFLLKLANEAPYSSMIFASSDFSDPLLWPEIIINYFLPNVSDTCVFLTLLDSGASDAFLASEEPEVNFGIHPEIAGMSWTCNGSPCYGRSVFKFDYSSLPSDIEIMNARLSLYANPTPFNGNGIAMNGLNSSVIQRVLFPWSEDSITWNNQPITTSINQVVLDESDSAFQDYQNIDITGLVKDDFTNSPVGNGFLLRLIDEVGYKSMIFSSSDYGNTSLVPKLKICYRKNDTIDPPVEDFEFSVYPNPIIFNNVLNVYITSGQNQEVNFKLYDMLGRLIGEATQSVEVGNKQKLELNLSDFNGLIYDATYLLKAESNFGSVTHKLVVIK